MPLCGASKKKDKKIGGPYRFDAFQAKSNLFSSNAISTTKYTPINFVPKNLFEQFLKLSNVYFLAISLLQLSPVSSVTPTAWLPLAFVLIVNMVKEGIEDARRGQMDRAMNNKETHSIEGGSIRVTKWQDVTVGSVLVLQEDEQLPSDVLVLASADARAGLCYIETANLDGETNLKNRESVEFSHRALTSNNPSLPIEGVVPPEAMSVLQSLSMECEPPNEDLNTFNGSLNVRNADRVSCNNKNMIYRGCSLKNTKWVYALVVYTGQQSKLMQNQMEKKLKRTTLEKLTNKYLIGIFILLATFCIIAGLIYGAWVMTHNSPVPYYLSSLDEVVFAFLGNMLTFLILMSAFIPISLTISMEMVKVLLAQLIDSDVDICFQDPVSLEYTPAKARTSNLCEDLGRIEYIFSDKTGTLTQNVMEFMKCSIAGVSYGTGTTEIGRAAAMRAGIVLKEESRPAGLKLERGDNFYDRRISLGAWKNSPDAAAIEKFFLNLAVCHTVMAKPRTGEASVESNWNPANVGYQASSPDEEALVIGAKGSGFWFKRRSYKNVSVIINGSEERVYEIMNINEFNSTRKRFSCAVRMPDRSIVLFVKGADSVIYERLGPDNMDAQITKSHLFTFANEGLRTLVLAERDLSETEYNNWNEEYLKAFSATEDREAKMDAVAELIEKNLTLVGATAIEDKLQVGVPQCIQKLAQANIQIWILTGDKVETAINIAMACNLIDTTMHLEKISLPDPQLPPSDSPDFAAVRAKLMDERKIKVLTQLQNAAMKTGQSGTDPFDKSKCALVIDGYSLEFALQNEEESGLQELGMLIRFSDRCKAVVCCRVSPKQKADVVSIVRNKKRVITLAIGDGANDVGMILKAHIGVGISGKEGVQAVMSSDYAIAQFRYLQQLVLIHGRWSFQRVSVLIAYSFYKNISFSLVTFWYGIYSVYSGVKFFDDAFSSIWNVLFTAFPIMAFALFEKDVVFKATLNEFPQLYRDVQKGQDFSVLVFGAWLLDAFWASLVCFFIPLLILQPPDNRAVRDDGYTDHKWFLSFTSYAACHVLANLRLAMITKTWNYITTSIFAGSIMSYFIFAIAYTNWNSAFAAVMYKLLNICWGNGLFWASIALVQFFGLIGPFLLLCYQKLIQPNNSSLVAAFEANVMREQEAIQRALPEDRYGKLLATLIAKAKLEEEKFSTAGIKPEQSIYGRPGAESVRSRSGQPSLNSLPGSPVRMNISNTERGEEEHMGFCFSKTPGCDPEVQVCGAHTVPGGGGPVTFAPTGPGNRGMGVPVAATRSRSATPTAIAATGGGGAPSATAQRTGPNPSSNLLDVRT